MPRLPLAGLLLAGSLLGGCASHWQDMFVSYSDQMVPLRNQLLLGHAAEALPEVRDSTPGDDTYVLDRLEQGRIAWLASQDAASKQAFAAADSRLAWEDNQAEYRVSQGLAQAGSLLTNDQTMVYRAPDYERTMLHHYLALNYLQRGDAEGGAGGGAPRQPGAGAGPQTAGRRGAQGKAKERRGRGGYRN